MGAVAKRSEGAAPETGRALTPREQLKAELGKFVPSFETLLPRGYDPARLVTGAMVAVAQTPELLKCDHTSIALSLARIAQWGLEVGVTAHLVPFKGVCTPIADYKGLIQLMLDAGARKVVAREVREGDDFYFEYGLNDRLEHRPHAAREGRITHAYAIVYPRGAATPPVFEVMTAEEINAIRASSRSWAKGELPAWYARKTVLRRISKYVARTPRLSAVLDGDEQTYDVETGEVLPVPAGRRITGGVGESHIRRAQVRTDPGAYTGDDKPEPEQYEPGDAAGEDDDLALDRRLAEEEG